MRPSIERTLVCLLAALALAMGLAACGNGSNSGSNNTAAEATETAGESGGEAEGEADTAAAEGAIAPYVGQPSPFPATEELKEVPKGATIAYMDCGSPFCAIFWEGVNSASQALGMKAERVKAGTSANTVASAFDSVVAKEPDAVIAVAEDPELWKSQLEDFQAKEIPVVTTGITNGAEYGIEFEYSGAQQSALEGELLANYVAAEMNPEANAVLYEVPELPFSAIISEKFTETIAKVCPACSSRTAKVGVAEFGTTAPSTIVSDLQANPDTDLAVFATDEMAVGLPAALQSAGIEIETLGNGPGPTNLQYIKEGKETAGFATDLAIFGWTLVDEAVRGIVGQELTGPEAEGASVKQFLRKADITFDPSKGWIGYPDFEERYEELWGVG